LSGIVQRRPIARRDIVGCYLRIADHQADAADRFLIAVEQLFGRLAGQPGLGEPCRFREPGFAEVRRSAISGFRNFLVYYQPIDGGIEILRVVHGARDQSKILHEEDPD